MLWIFNYCGRVSFWLTLVIVFLWFYKRSSFDYWQKLGIKSLKPVPFFGNIVGLILRQKSHHEILNDLYEALGDDPFGGIYQMSDRYLLIKDPKLVYTVLNNDFKFWSIRGPVLFFGQKPKFKADLTMNVGLASGDRWRMLRRKMSSAFTSYKVKRMYHHVLCVVTQLTEFVDKRMDATESVDFNTKTLAQNFNIEVAGLCLFGIQCHSFEKDRNELAATCNPLFTIQISDVIRLLVSPFSKRFWHKLNLPDHGKNARDFFTDLTLDVVNHRRQHQETRNDFLQLIMDMQNSHEDPKFAVANNGEQVPENDEFNEMDIVANAYFIYLADYETTSATFSFCLYELALNENIQEKLRADVQRVKDQSVELNYNSLKDMPYLDAVIAETLRKYPPAPSISRQCVEDYTIPETNIRVPAGTKLIIPIWSIHRDRRYYPNPEVFDPERFTGDRKYKQPNGQYLPFGDGPRTCFGKTFVEMKLKAAISTIILKYNIKPCDKTETPVKFSGGSLTLQPSGGMWVKFNKRKTEI